MAERIQVLTADSDRGQVTKETLPGEYFKFVRAGRRLGLVDANLYETCFHRDICLGLGVRFNPREDDAGILVIMKWAQTNEEIDTLFSTVCQRRLAADPSFDVERYRQTLKDRELDRTKLIVSGDSDSLNYTKRDINRATTIGILQELFPEAKISEDIG